jgi:hypothetical protein
MVMDVMIEMVISVDLLAAASVLYAISGSFCAMFSVYGVIIIKTALRPSGYLQHGCFIILNFASLEN